MPATALSNELGNWKYKKVMKPLPLGWRRRKGTLRHQRPIKTLTFYLSPENILHITANSEYYF